MPSAIWWPGGVDEHGVPRLDDRPGFTEWIKKFAGHRVMFGVRQEPRRQGSQSMRYYRGVVVPDIAKASGVSDPDDFKDVHEGLAWKFLRIADGPMGQPRRRSTAKDDLNQDEMTAFIDQCITWAETSIPGCEVRRTDEVDWSQVYDPGWR